MPGKKSVISLIASSRKPLSRIGIVDVSSVRWTAGQTYTQMLVHSLGNVCPAEGIELYLFSQAQDTSSHNPRFPAKIIPIAPPAHFRGEQRLRQFLRLPPKSGLFRAARDHQISVLLSLSTVPVRSSTVKTIGWIPDFQHMYLPEFFSAAECRNRDIAFQLLAQRAVLVMLSSQHALHHFAAFVPEYAYKVRVVPFPSLLVFKPPPGENVLSSRSKFNLPEKFALVANQFWQHKNHVVVIEALRILRQKGMRIPVVMTGLPADYRDPENRTLSQLFQAIASAGLTDQITILGLVAYADLVNLLRTAAVMIQPSRFEGWSTSIQDAKALGRPLICSDIPVHREQAADAIGFFSWDRADRLADMLAASWASLAPGPCLASEERALTAEREFARRHGETLLGICQEAHAS